MTALTRAKRAIIMKKLYNNMDLDEAESTMIEENPDVEIDYELLKIATKNGNEVRLQILLEKVGNKGIEECIRRNDIDIITLAVSGWSWCYNRTRPFQNAVAAAVKYNNMEMVKVFVGRQTYRTADYFEDGLLTAVQHNNMEMATFLMDVIKNKDGSYKVCWVALCCAIVWGRIEMVKLLINKFVMFEDSVMVPAVIQGKLDIVKFLVTDGGFHKGSALVHAALRGNVEIIDFLICNGADIKSAIRELEKTSGERECFRPAIELLKGKLRSKTRGICLVDMDSINEKIVQCECCKNWDKECVYCQD